MMGGALGLAVLASLAAAQTDRVARRAALDATEALNAGYRLAFLVGAICAAAARHHRRRLHAHTHAERATAMPRIEPRRSSVSR